MKTRDFHYNLPEHLIAQKPCDVRSSSRLLHYARDQQTIGHHHFNDIINLINANDLLVFNNTRVIPARIYGEKQTGGKVEILIERLTGEYTAHAHIRASKTPKPGAIITVFNADRSQQFAVKVTAREGELFVIESEQKNTLASIMESIGHMPLPPYIERNDTTEDFSRYQTVYASTPGAVAAPTAGLHFDEGLLQQLSDKGIASAYVTLHVGAGTFQPVRCEDIEQHKMHHEYLEVPQSTVDKVAQAQASGGRIIAVGTTSVRSLESAYKEGKLQAFSGETDIFIYPGYEFNCIDALITNFHLPESTLLMLISALASKEEILRCYQQAVEHEYRFFSYGDAMFIS